MTVNRNLNINVGDFFTGNGQKVFINKKSYRTVFNSEVIHATII